MHDIESSQNLIEYKFYMANERQYREFVESSPEYARGYLRAQERFCEVIKERLIYAVEFNDLKNELTRIIAERREFSFSILDLNEI